MDHRLWSRHRVTPPQMEEKKMSMGIRRVISSATLLALMIRGGRSFLKSTSDISILN